MNKEVIGSDLIEDLINFLYYSIDMQTISIDKDTAVLVIKESITLVIRLPIEGYYDTYNKILTNLRYKQSFMDFEYKITDDLTITIKDGMCYVTTPNVEVMVRSEACVSAFKRLIRAYSKR